MEPEAQGFLLKLVNLSLVDHEQFEGIMERVSVFGSKSVSLEQIKLIASSVVSHAPAGFRHIRPFSARADDRH